jgi:uncharacterized protein
MTEPADGFEWDDGNLAKCQKHGLSLDEIETAFHRPMRVFPALGHSRAETRYVAIGRTDSGRHLLVAFTYRVRLGQRLIRPISARYMHAKEIQHYEAQDPNAQETSPIQH